MSATFPFALCLFPAHSTDSEKEENCLFITSLREALTYGEVATFLVKAGLKLVLTTRNAPRAQG